MKEKETTILYDSSFNGFLSAVYQAFQHKLHVGGFSHKNESQVGLFSDSIQVETNIDNAKRVWEGLQHKNYAALKNIYFAFLSETNGIENLLYQYIRYIFLDSYKSIDYDISNTIKRISQLASLVGREKQRLETQIGLQSTIGEIRLAYVEPAFNVLPLISKHFRSRYKNNPWIIFDLKRNYGMYFNGHSIEMISSSFLYRLQRHKSEELNPTGLNQDYRSYGVAESNLATEHNLAELKTFTAA